MFMVTATATEALTTAIGSIATQLSSTIVSILPIALPIVGTMLVVKLGMKFFGRVTSNA